MVEYAQVDRISTLQCSGFCLLIHLFFNELVDIWKIQRMIEKYRD